MISTFAGGALPVNTTGTSAGLSAAIIFSVAADPAGNVFFPFQNTILRLDATTGVLSLVAGNGTTGFSGDNGPATAAQLHLFGYHPIAVDFVGNLYIADSENQRIRKVSNGVITTVAGNGTNGFSGDGGPPTSAQLSYPSAVAVDALGNLYIADSYNQRIRKVSNGVISTVAGNGTNGFSGDGGPATSACLTYPSAVAVDSGGNLYISDNSLQVRMVSNGVISTVAGNGTSGFSGDGGPATDAEMASVPALAVDSAGNLYIADAGNARVRKVSNGVITTVAGNGAQGFSGDNGAATSAEVWGEGVAVDFAGNLYIADEGRIRKVSRGVITTVAGNGTSFNGDHRPATAAQLGSPSAVAVDSVGNPYIADTSNNRVRKVSNGVITTVAGNGTQGFSGDNGPATNAQLNLPESVAIDAVGNIYIADTGNDCVRKVSNGVITTVAGNGTLGFSGDNGPATSAQLDYPEGVAVDAVGNIYVADTGNDCVAKSQTV